MKINFSVGVRLLGLLLCSALPIFSQVLRYNRVYVCKGEGIVVGHCRRDSDQPGMPVTKDEDNFCSVYYPDRPKRNGFEVHTVELRSDIIKTLEACGAFQEKQASLPQVSSGAAAAAPMDPDVDAANVLSRQGIKLLPSNKTEANKLFDEAIVKYKAAISRGSDLYTDGPRRLRTSPTGSTSKSRAAVQRSAVASG